ncbi:transglutaminase domain-containing protein [Solibacillus sp. A46]|uniref:Transglutaminase domain-containing protein n=1 Tax=Solibacillus faecavium TaxID=2762221 RepID=A0ABR8XV82_9BACL|nr:transglutaminase-like domain-containing protein [Solibacillus faecavium]MBD8035852.1 transglutaminase domain-containing protein [Solibacillus faecavium]
MKNIVNIAYSYHNSNKGLTRIWTTLPMDHHDVTCTHSPEEKVIDDGNNELFYFTLKENERFQMNYSVDTYKQNEQKMLTDKEKAFYLRSGTLVVVDEQMRNLAHEITAGAETTMEKARAIFHYVVSHFKYMYPPKGRGIKSFLEAKQGDCGEYSFMFSSLCRSIGIPCRSLVGSWANSKMNAHVWNEFFDEQTGWIPVDCSMAYIQKKKKTQFLFSNVRTLKWTAYFGQLEQQRVVFSYDAELYLSPKYNDLDKQTIVDSKYPPIVPFQIDGQPFYWGYEAVEGCVPYMQPIYVQFDQENLSIKPNKNPHNYLGQWKITETGALGFFSKLKSFSYFIFFISIIFSFLLSSPFFSALTAGSVIVICISFIARRERALFYTVVALYFLLPLLSNISKLV